MELYKEVEEKVGYYPDKFQFDGKIHRFGDKNVCWAIGYIFKSAKGSDRKLIICNNWSHGNDEPFKIYSDLELKADLAPGGNKKLQNIHKELMARIESEQFQFQKNQR